MNDIKPAAPEDDKLKRCANQRNKREENEKSDMNVIHSNIKMNIIVKYFFICTNIVIKFTYNLNCRIIIKLFTKNGIYKTSGTEDDKLELDETLRNSKKTNAKKMRKVT